MIHKDKLEKIYLTVIEWGVYLALFSPLIFIRSYFFPFVVPKTIFFRIIVDVIFIAYIILAVSNAKYRPKITPLTLAITAFIAVLFLTSILGVNFARSFWSVFERMTGLLTFLHLLAFYVVLTSVFQERKQWERILSVSLMAAIIICLHAFTSKDPLTRGGGTLGNSSFLSAYVLFNVFFAMILTILKKGGWRVVYGFVSAFLIFVLLYNPVNITRGTVAAFLVGMVLGGIAYLFFTGNKLFRKIALSFLVVVVVAGALLVKNLYFKDRPFNLLDIPDRSRKVVWSIGWESWQERFWLGWGWENFNVPFFKHYRADLPKTGDTWYDRVHNVVLDTGVSSGIVGLLSYLSIFAVAVFGLGRFAKAVLAQGQKQEFLIAMLLITLLPVYFLHNIWVFDMISSYIMFFLALAFMAFIISAKDEETKIPRTIPIQPFAAAILIILTVFTFFLGNIQVARASKAVLRGLASPLEQMLPAFQEAFKLSPIVRFEVPENFSFRVTNLASEGNQQGELLLPALQLVEREFIKSIETNPLDLRLYLFLGRNYHYLYLLTNDEEVLTKAEGALAKALELSPTNQQVYFTFAQLRFLQGRYEEALNLLQRARDLDPDFLAARWHLMRAFALLERYEEALQEFEAFKGAEGTGGFRWRDVPGVLKEVINILKKTGQSIDVLIPLYEKGVEVLPEDLYLWEDLVNAYIEAGDYEEAKAAVEKLLQVRPELAPEIEPFLEQLKQLNP